MKYIDINRKFTETVSSYIAQGYIINTASMSGSQGEIAHIDLTDGKQIVRVLLDSFTEWEDYNQLEGLKLVVGIAADNVKPNDNQRGDVIWNNRLDVISCEKFYKRSMSARRMAASLARVLWQICRFSSIRHSSRTEQQAFRVW